MPKVKSEQLHLDMREAIKRAARKQMAHEGTNAVSLRAVARELDLSAPSLYNYFPSRDDLITALIADAFNAIADAIEEASGMFPQVAYAERLLAMMMTYREWALEHKTDFQLIYGNPIPGYNAPSEITLPAARRGFEFFATVIGEAMAAGAMSVSPDSLDIPPTVADYLGKMGAYEGYDVPLAALIITTDGWTRMHGMIMLEIFEHIDPVVGDTEAYYRSRVLRLLREMGLKPTTS